MRSMKHIRESEIPSIMRAGFSRRIPVWLISLVIGIAYIIIQFHWDISTLEVFHNSIEKQADIVKSGNMVHAVGYAMVGLFGGLLLIWPCHARKRYYLGPVFPLIGYLSICIMSYFWSDGPDLTVRRLLILLFCITGVIGTSRHLSGWNLIHCAIAIAFLFISIGVFAELAHGTFNPLYPGYRFAGTLHPNSQGAICATLCLAAFVGFRKARSRNLAYLLIFLFGLLVLCLTKSRTSLAACSVAVYLTFFWRSSLRTKWLLVLVPIVSILPILIGASLLGFDFTETHHGILNMGRNLESSNFATLNGRLPLWATLKEYILQRPLLGHGYHGFWTPETIKTISLASGWTITHGHSVIIDLLLYTGIIGMIFFLLTILAVFHRILHLCRNEGTLSSLFAFAMMMFSILFGLMESSLLEPRSFEAFIACVSFANVCVKREGVAL